MKKPEVIFSTNDSSSSRRRFIVGLSGLAGAAALAASWPRSSHATDLPHLEETDPTGQALGYKEDAAQTDVAKFPNHQASQHCANCNFFQGAASGYGPCQLFAGKAVNAKGWCSAYAAKAG